MRSLDPVVGESARKKRSSVIGDWPAGTVTSAVTDLLLPAGITPVFVITAPFASLKTMLQPAGKVVVAKFATVLAARLNVSATELVLFTNKLKVVTVSGFVTL